MINAIPERPHHGRRILVVGLAANGMRGFNPRCRGGLWPLTVRKGDHLCVMRSHARRTRVTGSIPMTTELCIECNERKRSKNRLRCWECQPGGHMIGNGYTRKMKRLVGGKSACGKCGFKPEHACQMDVDHIDGNPKNNAVSNLMVLCANCHRLKTHQNGDGRWSQIHNDGSNRQ